MDAQLKATGRPTGPLHSSSRTAISENTDPETGKVTRVLCTSQLTLTWIGIEVQVKFRATSITMDPDRAAARRSMRRGRG